jgi:hypothetical protein
MRRVPRDRFFGEPVDGKPADEAYRCKLCGAWIEYRDLAKVFDHEGPLPHPAGDRPS